VSLLFEYILNIFIIFIMYFVIQYILYIYIYHVTINMAWITHSAMTSISKIEGKRSPVCNKNRYRFSSPREVIEPCDAQWPCQTDSLIHWSNVWTRNVQLQKLATISNVFECILHGVMTEWNWQRRCKKKNQSISVLPFF